MQQFIMLVGLPGSGKTTSANEIKDRFTWISSDAIRGELFGDENTQCDPNKVFSLMQSRTLDALSKGESVIYDATNIRRKNRLPILQTVKSKFKDVWCHCIIVWAKIETCIERNNNRERVVPESVIWRMVKQFETPWYDEGWNKINIFYTDDGYVYGEIGLDKMKHDNSHHENDTIQDHIDRVYTISKSSDVHHKLLDDLTSKIDNSFGFERGKLFNERYDRARSLHLLAKVHDIGKIYTKDFHNSKGEITEDAHYYQHQNVGAYMVLGLSDIHSLLEIAHSRGNLKLELSYLTMLHMEPFFDKQPSNYWKKKVDPEIKRLIYLFNECDRKGA